MQASALLFFVLLTLPWLNPFATGPSPSVVSWLLTVGVTGGLMLIGGRPGRLFSRNSARRAPPSAAGLFAGAWLFAGAISSLMGLLQYFGATAPLDPWVNATNLGEAFGNLRQRNQFASLTNIALASLLWFAIKQPMATQRDSWRVMLLPLAGLLAVGNAASQSRTGLVQLGLLCGLAVMWGLHRRDRAGDGVRNEMSDRAGYGAVRRVLITAVLAYAVAAIALPLLLGFDLSSLGIAARLQAGDAPCSSRLALWSNVLHLVAQKPWLGWGWGELDYAHFSTLYDLTGHEARFCDILDNAHNLPLQLAVELGVPVALLVCGGFAVWAVRQKPWAEHDASRQLAWAVMALILLHSLLEYPLWYGPFLLAFVLCAWLLARSKPNQQAQASQGQAVNRSVAHVLTALAAMLLIAFSSYAAWDYRRISQIYLPPEQRTAAYQGNTLAKTKTSWLFADQVAFAELLTTPLTAANAMWALNTAESLLHYSPEPRVVEKLIESAVLLGRDEDALAYLARYRAAFPKEHARWAKSNQAGAAAAPPAQ